MVSKSKSREALSARYSKVKDQDASNLKGELDDLSFDGDYAMDA